MKRVLALLIVPAISWAVPPVITPSIPTVLVSSTMQMNANQTVTWSLTPGSTGTINSATGVYTAPGPLLAKNVWLGSPLFPNDHIYNTRVDNLPLLTSTNTYFHANVVTVPLTFDAAFPENLYTNATPTTNLVFANSGTNGAYSVAGFPDLRVEAGLFTDSRQVDQHILAMNKDTGIVTELYKLYPIGFVGSGSCNTCNSGSGVTFANNYSLTQGVDAAGAPLAALSVRYSELRACIDKGRPIAHAMRFTLSNGRFASGFNWPAKAFAANAGAIPYGTRFRLKSSFVNSGSAGAQCIETALKNYGMFAVDGGLTMQLQFMQDVVGDYQLFQMITGELPFVSGLNSDNFDAVDESSLEDLVATSPTFQSGITNSTNAFVIPSNYAVVVASNTTTHESSYTPVVIQPVTVGVSQATGIAFMAGTPATQLNVWVHGSTDTTVSCSMTPTLGTLTSTGLYTPPASVVGMSSTSVTCAALVDATNAVSFPLIVYSTSGIRVALSNTTNVSYGPDVSGNTWFPDQGSLWRFQGAANCDFSGDLWTGVTDASLYKHCEYVNGGSGDQLYRFIVPNGTYKLTLKYGIGGSSPFTPGVWQESIDSQGTIFSSSPSTTTLTGNGPWTQLGLTGKYFDLCTLITGCAAQTPGSITFNSTVSDGNLNFAVRHLAPFSVSGPASILTAFAIEPVATPTGTSIKQFLGNFTIKGGGTFQ